MKAFNKTRLQRITPIMAGIVSACLWNTAALADGLATDYDSYPPLINTAGSGDKPNILLMLDTSGSMMQNASGGWVGSEHQTSRHVIARQAIKKIIDSYGDVANIGLMAFEPAPSNNYKKQTGGCYGGSPFYLSTTEWCGQNLSSGGKYVINRGYLYIPIGSVDPYDTSSSTVSRINEFNRRLGLNIVNQTTLTGYYDLFSLETDYYTSSTDYTTHRRLISDGGTPLAGTYRSAFEYYKGTLPSSLYDSTITASQAVWPAGVNQCKSSDFAILITDGLPTVTLDGSTCSSGDCSDAYTTEAETEAKALAAEGVATYVIGFAVGGTAAEAGYLNRMAKAGTITNNGQVVRGSNTALLASDLTQLTNALNKIFVDVINRTSSGTGAAVVANRGNGLSADFQALYTPQKTLDGKTVSWVGTLQAFFLDENGYFREDTNHNGLLDGYNVDRILEFEYSAADQKTIVNRSLSSSATNPAAITSTTPVDVEDIESIWNARDQLANVSDVLTQRSFSALANTGRHILTSVDGETLMNFSVITPSELSAAEGTEDTSRAEIASLNTQIPLAQAELQNSIDGLGDELDALAPLIQGARDEMTVQSTAAADDVAAKEADVAAAQSAWNDAVNVYVVAARKSEASAQGVRDTAKGAWDAAVIAESEAQDDYDAAKKALDDAQLAYEELLKTDGSCVSQPCLEAQSDRDAAALIEQEEAGDLSGAKQETSDRLDELETAQSNLDDAVTARQAAESAAGATPIVLTDTMVDLATAQSEFNTANGNLNTAKGDLSSAQTHQANVDADLALVQTWLNNLQTQLDLLQTAETGLLAQAEGISDDTAGQRESLMNDVLAVLNQLVALFGSVPPGSAIPELAALNSLIGNINAQLAEANIAFDSSDDGEKNSFNEWLAEVDDLMTQLESAQTTLITALDNIDRMAHIRYMDDGIVGQTGDVDLTYTQRNEIVKWVRGEDISGMRNRTIKFVSGGTEKVWRLPDIIHSTPVVVGRPSAPYYSLYADDTYRDYINSKFNRRQVVYVGSNGGMLHAFNAGFWDDAAKGYTTRLSTDTTSVQHPLGAELWAYIPKAALPHLQFVANRNYNHMYLVDGAPQVFDVNIFPPSATHPNGWGTILVVNMRLGGGPFTVRVDEDGDGVDEDVVVRPSVMIFDVTDPEAPPSLIAELSHPQMGFTLGRPALIKNRQRSNAGSFATPSVNRWLLVFGSGPTDLDTATSNQRARLYAYDLNAGDWATEWTNNPVEVTLEDNAYMGDASTEDWDRDYIDDVVYFGVNTGSVSTPDGRMARLRLRGDLGSTAWTGSASVGTLINMNRTVLARPSTQIDTYGRRWVSFGTGRLFQANDNTSVQQQYLYGVMEPVGVDAEMTYGSVSTGTLIDVSNIDVALSGNLRNGPTDVNSVNQLETYIQQNNNGWRVALNHDGTNPSGRNLVKATQRLKALVYNEYLPSNDVCEPEGTTKLYSINIMTGTEFPEAYLDTYTDNTGEIWIADSLDLGYGMYGEAEMVDGTLILHGSGGNVKTEDLIFTTPSMRRQSWRQIFDFGF